MGTFDILFRLIFWTYPEKISLVLFFLGQIIMLLDYSALHGCTSAFYWFVGSLHHMYSHPLRLLRCYFLMLYHSSTSVFVGIMMIDIKIIDIIKNMIIDINSVINYGSG